MHKLRLCRLAFVAALAAGYAFAQSTPPTIQAIKVLANDMAWDGTRSRFWVSTAANDPKYPNSILLVDPSQAQIADQITCDQPPNHLAVSADGQYLYATFDQLGLVRRYPLPSHMPDLQITLGSDNVGTLFATALAVLPDKPGSFIVAVAVYSVSDFANDFANTATIAVYDGSTKRPNTTVGPKDALFVQSATSVDAWGAGVVVLLNIEDQGVSLASAKAGLPNAGARAFDGQRYVTDDLGYVFDNTAGMTIGRAAGILRCFSAMDPAGDTVLALNTDAPNAPIVLSRYSLSTFRPLASVSLADQWQKMGIQVGGTGFMKTWGSDGLAVSTGEGFLVFLNLSSLQPVADSPPSVIADPSGAVRIKLQTGGLTFDAKRNHLLATVAGVSGGSLGNTIAQIDPASGVIVGSTFAGSEPGPISLTDDATRAFVGLGGAPLVVPVNLDSNAAEQSFSVLEALPPLSTVFPSYNPWSAEDLVTLAGETQSVAVVRATLLEGPRSIVVYDQGIARPNILDTSYLADRIYRADAANALFSLDLQDSSFTIDRLIVSSHGIAIDRPLLPIVGSFNGALAYESGTFYSSDGTIWTGHAPTEIGSIAGKGIPVPFPDKNAVAYATTDNGGHINVWLFDTNTYRPVSSIQLNSTDLGVLSAVRAGETIFALRTASEVILISWSNLQTWPDLTPTTQSVAPGVAKIPLLANAIAAAPDGLNLLVATSSTAGKYGNCVLTINPVTASVLGYGYVGSEPVALSVVPGANSLYASVAGETGIAHFNLTNASRDFGFTADPTGQGQQYYIGDIAAASDGSVTASFHDGSVAVFDQGKLQPGADLNNETFAVFDAQYQLALSSSGTMLYGYDPSGIKRFALSSTGIRGLTVAPGLTNGISTEIRSAGGLLYSSIGDVIDPERSRQVAQFLDPDLQQAAYDSTNSKHVWPDLAAGRVYFIAGTKMLVFDMYNFAEIGSLTLPYYDGNAVALVKVGSNLAFLIDNGDVYVVSISAITAIANPAPPPPVLLPSTPGVAVIDLTANDIAYNAANNRLYVTVPNSEGARGDSVVALDPGSGVVTATYFGAVNPRLIRVSDNGSTVYHTTGYVNNIILYTGEGLRSIDLSTGAPSLEFALLPLQGGIYVHTVADLVPLLGQPNSVATLYDGGTIWIYDGALPRPVSTPANFSCSSLQPGATPDRLYCYDGHDTLSAFSRLALDQNGVSVINSGGPNLIDAPLGSILYNQGLVYASNGRIIDPENLTPVATILASGSVAVDSGRIYYLSQGTSTQSPTMVLTSFDQNTRQLLETRTINVNSTTTTSRLVPCGNGRLAFAAGQQIYIVYPSSSEPSVPSFDATGVVSAASFASGASGGELVSIFGQNLVRGIGGVVSATQLPLPIELGGTSVTIGGIPAPLLAVSSGNGSGGQQINLQVPLELAGQGPLPMIVNTGGFESQPVMVRVDAAHPGIFMSSATQAIVTHADYSLVSASSPASQGEAIIIFCTGLGTVTPAVLDGAPAPSTPAQTTATPVVTIGGATANVLFSGLTPGLVGLYQVNAVVPVGISTGTASLTISVNGASSQPVQIATR